MIESQRPASIEMPGESLGIADVAMRHVIDTRKAPISSVQCPALPCYRRCHGIRHKGVMSCLELLGERALRSHTDLPANCFDRPDPSSPRISGLHIS